MRAVDAIMECLKAEGADAVFGIPGGANLPTYDALYDAGIRHILCKHEQGAGHAAEGYAKASGKVGVALATSGPGATNLITAIADAMLDSVPTVFITGQVRTDLLGTDGFQEADIIGISMPVVKHSFQVLDPREIPHLIHEAFHVARTGRPGPVLIDVPQDLSRADIPYDPSAAAKVDLPGYKSFDEGNPKQIRLAAKALANAKRPVIYAGGGVINGNAAEELTELVTTGKFPITCTVMGLGGFPAPHERWLGMLGMHGTRAANYAMDEADLIVAVGARFDDRITGKLSEFAPRAKFVHIDVDPAEISKNVPAHIPIVGNCKLVLPKLTAEYRAAEADPARMNEWWEKIDAWRKQYPLEFKESVDGDIAPQRMVQAMYEATKGDAIVTSDVGQHQMWTAQHYHFAKPRRWINSGGLGTMGFGLPSAIGAKVARPDELVVCMAGDGSLIMTCQEFATAVENNIDVKVFLMNNGSFGMVRQWQELFWEERYSHVHMGESPDWVKLAEAFGATGMRVDRNDELDDAMRTAIDTPGTVLVDVHVRKDENCYPMIPAGQAARDMVG
ncbi:MAG: biosynthetic-type acetolactate synthase large subunit [Solirubrobacterales bacterium]